MNGDEVLMQLLDEDTLVPVVMFTVGGVVAVVAFISGAFSGVCKRRQMEQSRREIAAYVAEGSMSPEEGERLLKSEPKKLDA
jgi:hypothetical protein